MNLTNIVKINFINMKFKIFHKLTYYKLKFVWLVPTNVYFKQWKLEQSVIINLFMNWRFSITMLPKTILHFMTQTFCKG